MTGTLVHTLLDDWRTRLNAISSRPLANEQSRVLQFLIRRYGDTDIAQRPALFPLRCEVYLNTRAILVHHALKAPERDAAAPARSILDRIAQHEPQASAAAPADGSMLSGADVSGASRAAAHPLYVYPFEDFWTRLRSRDKVEWALSRVHAALQKQTLLPEDVVKFLAANLDRPGAAGLLAKCENSSAVAWAVDAWRQERGGESLDLVFNAPHHAPAALRMFREELANPNPRIRYRAIEKVEKMGCIQDVGLLLDLVNLPPQPDDAPDERERLLKAAQALSERQ